MKKIRIVIRTSPVENPSVKRPFNMPKEFMVLECLKSLAIACQKRKKQVHISIIDDSSPEEFRNNLRSIFKDFDFELISIEARSNQLSYKATLDCLKRKKEDIFFLCEDDYYFKENAVDVILNAYEEKPFKTDKFCIHPTDYPDRYKKLYPSYIFVDNKIHWRTISHTTGTFVIPRSLFFKYLSIIEEFAVSLNESLTLNKIWAEIPLISPLPSLAAHLNDDTIPPFFNLSSLLDKMKKQKIKPRYAKYKLNIDNIKKIVKKILFPRYMKIITNNTLKVYDYLK